MAKKVCKTFIWFENILFSQYIDSIILVGVIKIGDKPLASNNEQYIYFISESRNIYSKISHNLVAPVNTQDCTYNIRDSYQVNWMLNALTIHRYEINSESNVQPGVNQTNEQTELL